MTNRSPNYEFAARQPLALIVLISAILAGLTIALWLLPLGVLAYGSMVFLSAHDPNVQQQAQQTPRRRLASATLRNQFETIERTQREIGQSVAQAPGPLRNILIPVGDQAQELVEEAYRLCEKGEIIERYLTTVNAQSLQDRINTIDQQLTTTIDQYTIQQLQETRDALVGKQNNARDLETYRGRINAQLQNISASLDNVLAETVRLRTADAVSANTTSNQVAQRLSDLKADMDAFQRVLDTALTQTGAAY
ncbi:MAG: hypothetical protein GFH27_549291n27 [Chloroflexi bacterium AL-W]|nr:hypothetical protein [Chloroflexi bacterium AL-N1]NOK67506.1 hypothetical protein [Chloroflexi bacterium AL-N10]NOK75002.1 hypothetical protein [Chloroflexi bacterium AL-N5]NOK81789.1 hypothetical protein [Chloroflexi bacterium AL-W]NOK89635.1 hypothetical protein [Chloroflexi bacterium AL-N15]